MNESKTNVFIVVIGLLTIALFVAVQYKKESLAQPKPPIQNEWKNWKVPENPKPQPQPVPPTQPEVSTTPKNYQEALEIAKRVNKPIFLYFYSDACHWCRKMKTETLDDPKVQAVLSNYVVYYVNTAKETSVARKYGVSGIPAYFIIDSNERVQKRGIGYKGDSVFLIWLK